MNLIVDVIRIRSSPLSRQTKSSTDVSNSRFELLQGKLPISVFIQLLKLVVHKLAEYLLVSNQFHNVGTIHNLNLSVHFLHPLILVVLFELRRKGQLSNEMRNEVCPHTLFCSQKKVILV